MDALAEAEFRGGPCGNRAAGTVDDNGQPEDEESRGAAAKASSLSRAAAATVPSDSLSDLAREDPVLRRLALGVVADMPEERHGRA